MACVGSMLVARTPTLAASMAERKREREKESRLVRA